MTFTHVRRSSLALGLAAMIAVTSRGVPALSQTPAIRVIKVTSLAHSGEGSLRACMAATGPRACVFEVAGRVTLSSTLRITSPGPLFVAGQTAPGEVMLTNAGVSVETTDVVLQHLAVRTGDGPSGQKPGDRDSLKVLAPAKRVLLEGLSVSWGVDENFSTYGAVEDVTVSNCILSEGLLNGIHPEGPHSMGALVGVGARRVLFAGNLFHSNKDRNIRWREDTSGRMVGNVVSGWGGSTNWNTTNPTNPISGPPILLDLINNVYLKNASSTLKTPAFALFAQNLEVPRNSRFFLSGNISGSRSSQALPEWNATNLPLDVYRAVAPLYSPDVPAVSATVVEDVLRKAGARPWSRAAVDSRIVAEVRGGAGRLVDCVEHCRTDAFRVPEGGYPALPEVYRPLNVPTTFADAESLAAWLLTFEGGAVPAPTVTAISTPTPLPTWTATATPTRTATPSPTPTSTPTPVSGCESTTLRCRLNCEECERYHQNKVARYPYVPSATCEQKLATCRTLCETGCK